VITRDMGFPRGIFFGGNWYEQTSRGDTAHINLVTGRNKASFAIAGPDEGDQAVEPARAAHAENTWGWVVQ